MKKQWDEPGFFLGEEDFARRMKEEVEVFWGEYKREGDFTGCGDVRIHYSFLRNPRERAAIVICHGFCEFEGKYREMMYYFYQLGYSVFFVAHRGHGFSQRLIEEPDWVYVRHFDEYVEDLHTYMEQIVTKESASQTYFLYAHSMGGAIGALFLEKYPAYFTAAVLNAPMMEMFFTRRRMAAAKLYLTWVRLTGGMEKLAPGQRGYREDYDFAGSCTASEPRYAYFRQLRKEIPEYRNSGGTCGWTAAAFRAMKQLGRNAARVQIPVLLCQAGKDTLVAPGGQERFAKKSGHTQLVRFPKAKHEIFNTVGEMRTGYYGQVFSFLESNNCPKE